MRKIGFIGCGKMAKAIIKGGLNSNFIEKQNIIASKSSSNNIKELSKDLGIEIILDNKFLVQNSEIIFLAVKPSQINNILEEIKEFITEDKLIVSIAAGVTTKTIENSLIGNTKVIRVMPNTPALIGEGMSGICRGKYATDKDLVYIEKLFSTIGKSIIVDENQIDIVTAISGSGPAFYYKIINDIAKAGEKLGLEYEKSLLLSIQTALGSAKMALNREISMEELISNVATKGGCTRVGVDVMVDLNTQKLFEEVVSKTTQKARDLGQ